MKGLRSVAVLVVASGLAAPTAAAAPLPPIQLTQAGADAQRRPFARWTPDYPFVNVRVTTRPVRGPGTQPSSRYWVRADTFDRADDGPAPFWRGDPLVPGMYYTSIQGDAASQGGMAWTPFRRFRVAARRGEWTGPTSQRRYLRFTRPRRGVIQGLAFSVFARPCGGYAALSLPGQVKVRRDGRFSARGTARSTRWVGAPRVRITGRIRRGFSRGTIRVDGLFEGCSSGSVRWSARRR